MQKSLANRALAKAQTLVIQNLMRLTSRSDSLGEDLHLLHYTPAQTDAETKLQVLPAVVDNRVLLVIPFRDKWELTRRCLDGLVEQDFSELKVCVALADNGSQKQQTAAGIKVAVEEFKKLGVEVRHFRYEIPFNFSYLNNQAVKDATDFRADVIGLINNDIEFLDKNCLKTLVGGVQLPKAGAVGATLLYPNGLIQHLFIFAGSKIVGSHPYKGKPIDADREWYKQPRAVSGVTGAVMFMKTSNFLSVEGFDEQLPTSYQDVDLCLKFQKAGLVNWVIPSVMLVHHETQTRSREPSWAEAERVEKRWGKYLIANPFVSKVWSRKSEHFVYTPCAFFRNLFTRVDIPSIDSPAHPSKEPLSRPSLKS